MNGGYAGAASGTWRPRRDAAQDRRCEPPRQLGGSGDRAARRAEKDPRQDLAMDRADDQGHGGVDVGGLVDAAEPLLGAQVGGQDGRFGTVETESTPNECIVSSFPNDDDFMSGRTL